MSMPLPGLDFFGIRFMKLSFLVKQLMACLSSRIAEWKPLMPASIFSRCPFPLRTHWFWFACPDLS